MPILLLLLLLMLLAAPSPAPAVLIDSGDGTGNTSAPIPDPGWSNVGLRGPLTAVYLGNSYVITAAHAGFGDVFFDGVPHQAVPGTNVIIQNPDTSPVDLRLFSIHPIPALPTLTLPILPPGIGDEILLVGNGRDRGAVTSFDPNGPTPPAPIGGYLWLGTQSIRWGTNEVEAFGSVSLLGATSDTFAATFDAGATTHEGAAATGDSGGAVFHNDGGQWDLAGIMIAVSQFGGQVGNSTLYGNTTHSVDLSAYRSEILSVIALPEPVTGFWWGAIALGVLARLPSRG
jgi:hypothetical protein